MRARSSFVLRARSEKTEAAAAPGAPTARARPVRRRKQGSPHTSRRERRRRRPGIVVDRASSVTAVEHAAPHGRRGRDARPPARAPGSRLSELAGREIAEKGGALPAST